MHTFKLNDRKATPHEYRVEPHPGGAGVSLALRVQALATEPILEVIRAVAGAPGIQRIGTALQGGDTDGADLVAGALGELIPALQTIDLSSLGRALSAALGTKDGPDLVRQILSRTYHDGKALSEPMHFDAAYQANYGELMQAVLEVVKYNGFFPLAEVFTASSIAAPKVTPPAVTTRARRP